MQEDFGQYAFVASLKACAKLKDLRRGCRIHAEIARKGLLEKDIFLGNALISMYASCGSLVKAQEVFNGLCVRDVVSWNALITAYVQHQQAEEALHCSEHMQLDGVVPNAVTLLCSLKACGSIGASNKGLEIHADITTRGLLEEHLAIGTELVDMYLKCGLLSTAQKVFDKLPFRNVVTWSVLIAGYAQHEHGEEALNHFGQMQLDGVSPDPVTFICTLKACAGLGTTYKGQEIHSEIIRKGFLDTDVIVGTALVDMYAKCGSFTEAQEMFDKLQARSLVSWSALIAGYAQHGHGEKAINCFKQMQLEGFFPNAVTLICALKACGSMKATDDGRAIHSRVAKTGLLERELVVGNALVDMYAKCGLLKEAQNLFHKLPSKDVITWNALIAGYVQEGCGEEALNQVEQMQLDGICPNAVTFVCSLKACGSIRATEKGQKIHAEVASKGWLEKDTVVGTALVDMYAKCGEFTRGQEVFDKILDRNVVLWGTLIASYAQHGYSRKALKHYEQMQLEGVLPNAGIFVSILSACSSMSTIGKGKELHAVIATTGLLDANMFVGNAMVEMYAKSGCLTKAQYIFDKLPVRDIFSWSALITGYSQLGEAEHVFHLFDNMVREGQKPNLVTFISVMNACSHTGLVDRGLMYFESMKKDYCIIPTSEHYCCIIDLLGRAGQVDKALALVKKMPFPADLVVWHTVLSACLKWGSLDLGMQAFGHAVQLDERDPAAFICISKIISYADMQDDEPIRIKTRALLN